MDERGSEREKQGEMGGGRNHLPAVVRQSAILLSLVLQPPREFLLDGQTVKTLDAANSESVRVVCVCVCVCMCVCVCACEFNLLIFEGSSMLPAFR
jgi:hypothetical protein